MKQSAPLSAVQYGLYVECVNHLGEPCYNLPYLYAIDGSLDGERLCRAIETAVKAHPTLFTRIEVDDAGEPMQSIDMSQESFELHIEEVTDVEALKPTLVEPFDIYGGRLFRVRLFHDASHYHLFIDYHHIIVDGTSMQVMLQDIDKAYQGMPIEAEQQTMLETALNDAQRRQGAEFEEAKQWYAAHFD
ncbi:MAG: hypothetical protein II683_02635, partial [Muribaculaceae bacterium]|nr:hypothetical protein [Muribaculaceae bacterium]